eukprot:CAMPEP_0170532620 /NCGR_PEP_ID=MMETSP0209-20121228/73869_1 /TAXON_ID=665100 ORGANISM="Litonotus pictus, Strain P1" /NCGR_SAMPLE_ID=MMETSP0209 /ASSEMBLY_ACC=CAM_ASM_000301 /LENGTH=1966 /DNA_ID=CAMNT_0010829001 /DNA_START=1220 /DNA_END=7117 /DNA_ORIENTATION=+
MFLFEHILFKGQITNLINQYYKPSDNKNKKKMPLLDYSQKYYKEALEEFLNDDIDLLEFISILDHSIVKYTKQYPKETLIDQIEKGIGPSNNNSTTYTNDPLAKNKDKTSQFFTIKEESIKKKYENKTPSVLQDIEFRPQDSICNKNGNEKNRSQNSEDSIIAKERKEYIDSLVHQYIQELEVIKISKENIFSKLGQSEKSQYRTSSEMRRVLRENNLVFPTNVFAEMFDLLLTLDKCSSDRISNRNGNSNNDNDNSKQKLSLERMFELLDKMNLLSTDYKQDDFVSLLERLNSEKCLFQYYESLVSKEAKQDNDFVIPKEEFISKIALLIKNRKMFSKTISLSLLERYYEYVNSSFSVALNFDSAGTSKKPENRTEGVVDSNMHGKRKKEAKIIYRFNGSDLKERGITIKQLKKKLLEIEGKDFSDTYNESGIKETKQKSQTIDNMKLIDPFYALSLKIKDSPAILQFQDFLRQTKTQSKQVIITMLVNAVDNNRINIQNFTLKLKKVNHKFSQDYAQVLFNEIYSIQTFFSELQKEASSKPSKQNTVLDDCPKDQNLLKMNQIIENNNQRLVKFDRDKDKFIYIDNTFRNIVNVYKPVNPRLKINSTFNQGFVEVFKENINREELQAKLIKLDLKYSGKVHLLSFTGLVQPYLQEEFLEEDLGNFLTINKFIDSEKMVDYNAVLSMVYYESNAQIQGILLRILQALSKYNKEKYGGDVSKMFTGIKQAVGNISSNSNKNIANDRHSSAKLSIEEMYKYIKDYIYHEDFSKNLLYKFDLDKDGFISFDDLNSQLSNYELKDTFKYDHSLHNNLNRHRRSLSQAEIITNDGLINTDSLIRPSSLHKPKQDSSSHSDSYFKSNIINQGQLSHSQFKLITKEFKNKLASMKISIKGFLKILDPLNTGFVTAVSFNKAVKQIYPLSDSLKDSYFNYLDAYKIGMVDHKSFLIRFQDYDSLDFCSSNTISMDCELRIIKTLVDTAQERKLDPEGLFIMLDSDSDGVVNKEDLGKFIKEIVRFETEETKREQRKCNMIREVNEDNLERVIQFIAKGSTVKENGEVKEIDPKEDLSRNKKDNKDNMNYDKETRLYSHVISQSLINNKKDNKHFFSKHDLKNFFERKANFFSHYFSWVKSSSLVDSDTVIAPSIETSNKDKNIRSVNSNNLHNSYLPDLNRNSMDRLYSSYNLSSEQHKLSFFLVDTVLEKLGLFISEHYSSIQDCFNQTKAVFNSKKDYLSYTEFLYLLKDKSLIAINLKLTQDEMLLVFSALDAHKKSYLTVEDMKIKLDRFNFFKYIHDNISSALMSNYSSAEEAFKYLMGNKFNKVFNINKSEEEGKDIDKDKDRDKENESKGKTKITNPNDDHIHEEKKKLHRGRRDSKEVNIYRMVLTEKVFIEEIGKIMMDAYNPNSLRKYFSWLLEQINKDKQQIDRNDHITNTNTNNHEHQSHDKSQTIDFFGFKHIFFGKNTSIHTQKTKETRSNKDILSRSSSLPYLNNDKTPFSFRYSLDMNSNSNSNTNNSNHSSIQSKLRLPSSHLKENPSSDPLQKLKSALKMSRFDYSNYFSMHFILDEGLLSEYKFKNMLRGFNIGLTWNEITDIAKLIPKNKEGKFIIQDFVKYLLHEDETSKKINQNIYVFVSELKNMVVLFHGNPRIAINTYLKQKSSEEGSSNNNSGNQESKGKVLNSNGSSAESQYLNFNDFSIIVKSLFEKARQQPPNFTIIQNMFRFIDLKKDGLIDSFEWNKVFSQVQSKGEITVGSNSSINSSTVDQALAYSKDGNSLLNIYEDTSKSNHQNSVEKKPSLNQVYSSKLNKALKDSTLSLYAKESLINSNKYFSLSNTDKFSKSLTNKSTVSKLLREWETSDDYNKVLDTLYKNRKQIRNSVSVLLIKDEKSHLNVLDLKINLNDIQGVKRLVMMDDLILVLETLFSQLRLSKTQWRIVVRPAQICKTGKVDIELLFSLAKDQKKRKY